ncbi:MULTISPECIES: 30S ribosomal protein S16 [Leptolyngbya]|uniref:Small ribosomal subunit protein bS16 n=2 Tax=Leptolyngbya boryana TaxID=1184 RepID=A0A1Z4JJE9_LEPBY|nr:MULTISPECIES: 30S ribosomal protein S16 [Leptolyngbya]BAY56860.1 30S ribosomal protein S16 [Leptolyngbya boryana NIES-2135]
MTIPGSVAIPPYHVETIRKESSVLVMLKLRLKRFGKKREASYRIVVAQSTTRRDGRPLAEVGFYNPRSDEVRLDVPKILDWMKKGAQPTDTVRDILFKNNVLEQLKAE